MKPYYARLAASLLSRAVAPERRPNADERARAILQIEGALRQKRARRTRRRWAISALVFTGSAAAAVALYLRAPHEAPPRPVMVSAVVSPIGAGARVFTPMGIEPLQSGTALLPGSRLIAASTGGAKVHLSTGTEIEIRQDTSVQFSEAGPVERFMLSRGDMLARVAKLQAGERFIVSTPDAEVEVRGTVFHVAVVESDADCAAGNQTRVEVLEGIVEVRANGAVSRVRPGQRWPAACARVKAAPLAHVAEANGSSVASRLEPSRARAPHRIRDASASGVEVGPGPRDAQGPASTEELSRTKLQNELFSQAVSARHAGDTAGAISKFQALMTQYPGSPLAEGAAAERMRLLAASDPAAAQRAARDYVARYPKGFAINDALAILKGR